MIREMQAGLIFRFNYFPPDRAISGGIGGGGRGAAPGSSK
jgi:hypothetical protein